MEQLNEIVTKIEQFCMGTSDADSSGWNRCVSYRSLQDF